MLSKGEGFYFFSDHSSGSAINESFIDEVCLWRNARRI
jgi:hypothetical protein